MTIEYKRIHYGSVEYALALALRRVVLREPLQLHYTISAILQEQNQQHFVAIGNDEIIASVSLLLLDNEVAKLRQMCVDKRYQRSGVGEQLIRYIENELIHDGVKKIELHARKNAIIFYEKCGYNKVGIEFEEVGLPHSKMEKMIQ